MPFTPFHMGAGLAVKAGMDRHFSLLTFGIAQIAMDIEPLIGMVRNAENIHGVTHNLLGALLIGIVVAVISPAICNPILRRYNSEVVSIKVPWLACPAQLTRKAVMLGAFIGTFSHILLDSLMHTDMQPFWPLSDSRPLLFLFSVDTVYAACFWIGCAATFVWMGLKYFQKQKQA